MEGRFGHAWVTLLYKGSAFTCGYSGEINTAECGYFERLIDLAEAGDPNPVRALFETREDGFLQNGSGGHSATYSIGVPLKEEAAEQILTLMQQQGEGEYSITKSQCVTFVLKAAAIAGLDLEAEISLTLPSDLPLKRGALHLFSDPKYATFTFLSPDRLEKSMMEAVKEGRAIAIKTPRSFCFKGCTLERAKILFSVQGLP